MASLNTPTEEEKQLDDGGFDFLGKELDDNARIWNVYRDEITAEDKAHGFELWLQTLDVLLIFAGLFSAVVTAFLIDSYKRLEPDPNDFIAAALYALVVATNNSALLVDLPKPRALSSAPSSSERWVNALWFTSLIIALAVALLAILAKQWLQEFHRRLAERNASNMHTPSSVWTRKRWFYLRGMIQTWPMDGFITYFLPVMLHIALFLFLAGLSLFLSFVDDIVSRLVLALSAFILVFYVACTLLPLWCPDAPTSTPLRNQLLHTIPTLLLHLSIAFCKFLENFETPRGSSAGPLPSSAQTPSPAAYSFVQGQRNRLIRALFRLQTTTDPSIVRSESLDERDRRRVDILTWLIVTCTSENAVMIGFQGVGALDPDSRLLPRLREATVGMSALAHFGSNKTPSTLDAIRAIRSELVLGRGTWRSTELVLNVPIPMLEALRNSHVPEAMLLFKALGGRRWAPQATGPLTLRPGHALTEYAYPSLRDDMTPYLDLTSERQVSSLASTARLLLRCKGRMHFDVLIALMVFLDHRTLPLKDYDHFVSLSGEPADTTRTAGSDAIDRCVAMLLQIGASEDKYKPRVTRIIWRLMSRFERDAPSVSGDYLETLEEWLSLFRGAVIFDQPRPNLCAYARERIPSPVLAMFAAVALLQSQVPPLDFEQRVNEKKVYQHISRHLPGALVRLLQTEVTASQSHRIQSDVWVSLLKQTINFNISNWLPHYAAYNHSMAASLCWLQRRILRSNNVLDDLKDRLWKAISQNLTRVGIAGIALVDVDILHLAQHVREIFPDWRRRLRTLELTNNIGRIFTEIVGNVQPCTTCPGTPPVEWLDEPDLAPVTVPSSAAQQHHHSPSHIAPTAAATSPDPLAESPTAHAVPIAPSPLAPSTAPAASNSAHSPVPGVSSVSPSASLDGQRALHVSVLEPEPVLAPTIAPRTDDEVEPVSGPDTTVFHTPADAVPEPETGVQAPVADGTVISAPSASSEAHDSPLLSPQVLAAGPAHLGTDEDVPDSSSSADVGHPTSDGHASDDRKPASGPHETAQGAASEVAQGGTGGAGATPPAVTPKADASTENLVLPIDEAPTQPPRTIETDPNLPRSVTSDNEDM